MKLDRQIVDDFLGGSTDLDSWIFSEIEPGKRLFCLSDVQTRQSEIGQLAEQITRMAQQFLPCNEAYYTRLFPDFHKELQDYPVLLTVGIRLLMMRWYASTTAGSGSSLIWADF